MVNALGVILVVGGVVAVYMMVKNKKSTLTTSQQVTSETRGTMRAYKKTSTHQGYPFI